MRALLALALIAAQATPSSAPQAAQSDAPAAKPLPEVADLDDGLRRMQELCAAKQYADARAIGDALLAPNRAQLARSEWEERHAWTRGVFAFCEPLLDLAGAGGLTAPERAEVRYAQGVVAGESGDLKAAEADFDTALALAGPGSLRLDAGYDRGAVALAAVEKVRLETTGAPAKPQAAREGDPLAALEQMYLHAKDLLVQRLRADWHDADTRANLELIQRRLREIAEQKKEQEAQKEQQKQDKQDQKDSKDPEGQKDQQQKQEQQQSDSQQGDQQQGEQQPADPKDQKQSEQEQKDAQADPRQEAGKEASQASQGDERETRVLTREEMMRLLDQLEQIEKQGRTLQARLKDARRKKTDKDW